MAQNETKPLDHHHHHECIACINRVNDAPLSPAQSYPVSKHFTCSGPEEDLNVIRNNKGVLGEAYLEICESRIDVPHLTEVYASCECCGAISTFLGVTRNHFNGQKVSRLEYEAFSSMAIKQMTHIVKNIFSSFDMVHRVVISHRIGVVPVKGASVFIAVTTEHRESGLAAVAFAINTLKAKVPIWKREHYELPQQQIVGTNGDERHDHQSEDDGGVWKRNSEYSSPTTAISPSA